MAYPAHGTYSLSRATVTLSAGTHEVYHTDPSATYFAMLSGLTDFYSYGITAGSRVVPINAVSNMRSA